MAVTHDSFVLGFPEFSEAGRALFTAKIAEAVLLVDGDVWGSKEDLGVSYWAAHLLAMSPWGQQSRMLEKKGRTTYEMHLDKLIKQVTSGFRVI